MEQSLVNKHIVVADNFNNICGGIVVGHDYNIGISVMDIFKEKYLFHYKSCTKSLISKMLHDVVFKVLTYQLKKGTLRIHYLGNEAPTAENCPFNKKETPK
jgi:hypothetical protein